MVSLSINFHFSDVQSFRWSEAWTISGKKICNTWSSPLVWKIFSKSVSMICFNEMIVLCKFYSFKPFWGIYEWNLIHISLALSAIFLRQKKRVIFLEKNDVLAFPFQVKQNLVAAIPGSQVSFPFFMAFISLLSNIELIKKIYLNATNGSRTIEITKGSSLTFKIIARFAVLVPK